MLYKNTEDAICNLLSGKDKKNGQLRVIFDLGNLTASASFPSEYEAAKAPHLQPGEAYVDCRLQPAEELGVAIRAAAFNAVAGLARITNIDQVKGETPHLYGTMTLPSGEVVPYDESVMGFVNEDCHIHDPTLSECGRFTVDPVEAYGFALSSQEDGKPYLTRQVPGGELRLTDPFRLIRVAASGDVLACAGIDQIPTGEDYPKYITDLSSRAMKKPIIPHPQPDYLAHGLTGGEPRDQVELAVNLLINEGLKTATDLEEETGMPLQGPAGIAARINIGTPSLFDVDKAGIGKLSIPLRGADDIDQSDLREALEWVMQQGQERVKQLSDEHPSAALAKQLILAVAIPTIDLTDDPAPAM